MNKSQVVQVLETERNLCKHHRSALYNSTEGIKEQLTQLIIDNTVRGIIYYYDDDHRKLCNLELNMADYR